MLSSATLGDYLSVVKSLRAKVWLKITNTSYFLVACNVLGVFQIENVPLGKPPQRLWPSSPNQWTVLTVDWNRFGKYVWSLRWESETAAECWAHVRRSVCCAMLPLAYSSASSLWNRVSLNLTLFLPVNRDFRATECSTFSLQWVTSTSTWVRHTTPISSSFLCIFSYIFFPAKNNFRRKSVISLRKRRYTCNRRLKTAHLFLRAAWQPKHNEDGHSTRTCDTLNHLCLTHSCFWITLWAMEKAQRDEVQLYWPDCPSSVIIHDDTWLKARSDCKYPEIPLLIGRQHFTTHIKSVSEQMSSVARVSNIEFLQTERGPKVGFMGRRPSCVEFECSP